MKSKLSIIISMLLLLLSVAAQASKTEFRGLWVQNWLPGLLSPVQVDETVQWAKHCNMNVLIVQVRKAGDAYYVSSYEPRADNIQGGNHFDPLAYTIKKARANGLEVHAWFNVFRVCAKGMHPSDPMHVALRHPEWLNKTVDGSTSSEDGQFLDPGIPEVRQYIKRVIADLVGKYDLDGLMLDYIRYPGSNWGYSDKAVAEFNKKYGRTGKPSPTDPIWCNWRREQVTETVRAIHKEIQAMKPSMKLSASTIAWGDCPSEFEQTSAYKTVFQDWKGWMQEGIIDANMPMNYKNPSKPNQEASFVNWVKNAKKWSYGKHVYCGLMVYNVAGTPEQIEATRKIGVNGVVGLAFSQESYKTPLAEELRSTVFTSPAKVPAMPWKSSTAQLLKQTKPQSKKTSATIHPAAHKASKAKSQYQISMLTSLFPLCFALTETWL